MYFGLCSFTKRSISLSETLNYLSSLYYYGDGMMAGRIKCPKCGKVGYRRLDKKPSGTYLKIQHIRECYVGRVERGIDS